MLPRSARPGWVEGAALAIGFVGLASACTEQVEPAAAAVGEGGPGRILYLTYCQSCHGAEGRGDGPAAASLRIPPPDLTQLWTSYGTPLDRERLGEYIDGRWLAFGHGPREMPVWGDAFFEDSPPLATDVVEAAKRHVIEVLVGYLETLQDERQL